MGVQGRFRKVIAAWAVASLLAAGCRGPGGVVRFVEPEGVAVRIGGDSPRRIPFEARLPVGAQPIAFGAAGPSDSPSASPGEDTVRGWIVVLEDWTGEPAEFSASFEDLRDAASGAVLRASGLTPEGLEAFRVRASSYGVDRDDPAIAEAETLAGLRLTAEPPSGFLNTMQDICAWFFAILFYVFLILPLETDDEDGDDEFEEDC